MFTESDYQEACSLLAYYTQPSTHANPTHLLSPEELKALDLLKGIIELQRMNFAKHSLEQLSEMFIYFQLKPGKKI